MKLELDGVKEVIKALESLPPNVEKQVLRKAMRSAMKPLLAQAKAEAPVKSGLLRSSIVLRAAKKKKRGSIAFEIRPDGKKFAKGFYPAQVEFGRKDMLANPFMARAFASAGGTARDLAVQAILKGILQLADKGR